MLHFRPNKGGGDDDSDDEEGGSRPKKQRKPKERKRIEKVHSFLCSVRVVINVLEILLKYVFRPNIYTLYLILAPA